MKTRGSKRCSPYEGGLVDARAFGYGFCGGGESALGQERGV